MKAVIQRVSHSKLKVDKSLFSEIGSGLMILLGITHDDNLEDLVWLAKKVAHLRIFDDEDGVMNKSVMDVNGEIQVVSQFTLFALTKKGNRPSYINAAKVDFAKLPCCAVEALSCRLSLTMFTFYTFSINYYHHRSNNNGVASFTRLLSISLPHPPYR